MILAKLIDFFKKKAQNYRFISNYFYNTITIYNRSLKCFVQFLLINILN